MLRTFMVAKAALARGRSGTAKIEPGLVALGIFMVFVTIGLIWCIKGIAYGLTLLSGNPLLSIPMLIVSVLFMYALFCTPGMIAEHFTKKKRKTTYVSRS